MPASMLTIADATMNMILMKLGALPLSIPVAGLLLAGCAGAETGASPERSAGPDGELIVLSAFYPYHFLAERIGGDNVTAEILTEPGVEPHDVELSPRQVAELGEADLVIYQDGFQPAVDEAVEQLSPDQVLEANDVLNREPAEQVSGSPAESSPVSSEPSGETSSADEHGADEHGANLASDPHVWLNTETMATLAAAVADALAEVDPEGADEYQVRADELAGDLADLDEEFRAGLEDCERDAIVVNHAAFGHLTERYGLEQIPVNGLTPDAAPTPERLAEIAAVIESEGATTVYTETLTSPRLAETLADEAGVKTATLDPLEGLAEDDEGDFLSVMRENLEALRAGLGCG